MASAALCSKCAGLVEKPGNGATHLPSALSRIGRCIHGENDDEKISIEEEE